MTDPVQGLATVREVVWREDPSAAREQPETADEARSRLDDGNATFVQIGAEGGRHVVWVGPEAFGLPRSEDSGLPQEPFAAVLGCSDARVPVELVFGQAANSVFVVRVAGNVPGTECVGSLSFAVHNLPTLRLVVVLGHTRCGAVTAAVDALLAPETYLQVVRDQQLRAIVDSLLASVRMAALALSSVHGEDVVARSGYRAALIDTAVVANAAITASMLQGAVARDVAFGVFDLDRRIVGVAAADGWHAGLASPPSDDAALADLLRCTAATVLPVAR